MAAELRVVATAGHVDHGKSALIERLTGSDPDRLAEEQRRGLTIDLGYAWCELPGGREVGFVDVPGHERFVRTMLAGVGPVRLVLFVVAADEGWKPQSEEHLQILDVLGVAGGVIALTKRDLVDDETLALAQEEVRERVAGTVLDGAPLVPVSAHRGDGIEALRTALAGMLASAAPPAEGRTRLFVDRVFTIRGAGTVATGTLTGNSLTVGEEIEIVPRGRRARIRSLQTHRRDEERADPVSRVAANLVGVERDDLRRGDVLAVPGAWPATSLVEARLRPVRGLGHAITSRGAFTVHAGAAEAGAQLRILGGSSVEAGDEAFVRLKLDRPLVLEPFDRFVLREEGRGETVGGGEVLDVDPPARVGKDPEARLAARADARRDELPTLLVTERGAVTARDAVRVTGSRAAGGIQIGTWLLAPAVHDAVGAHVTGFLASFHAARPLDEGAPLDDVRRTVADELATRGAPRDPDLTEVVLDDLAAAGRIVRTATAVRLASHRVALDDHTADVERLLEAITGEHEAKPPGVDELVAAGFGRDVIDAAARAGIVVRLTPAIVVAPSFVERAAELVRAHAATGVTVSTLRQALGTSRKYAVPLAEHLDRTGLTRRNGDLRFPR